MYIYMYTYIYTYMLIDQYNLGPQKIAKFVYNPQEYSIVRYKEHTS